MTIHLNVTEIPPEEHDAAFSISGNVGRLCSLADEFRSTLDLWRHTRDLTGEDQEKWSLYNRWAGMAGRNGAIVAYGFWMLMQATNAIVAPTIWSKADLGERRRGQKLFAEHFPEIASIRTSAAHPGELSKNPENLAKHSMRERSRSVMAHLPSESKVFMEGNMFVEGDKMTYASSFNGKLVSYQLSEKSCCVLEEAAGAYMITFMALAHPVQAGSHRWHSGT